MDVIDTVATKLDVREFAKKKVPANVKSQVLEAARLTQSGNNTQHWRFILIQDPANLKTLAKDSKWGKWVEKADFAVIVLIDPTLGFHLIDAGRVVQDMELTAWASGVTSCVFTGLDEGASQRDFKIPKNLTPSIVVGFGYPVKKLLGKKNRKPLSELAFLERFGNKFAPANLA